MDIDTHSLKTTGQLSVKRISSDMVVLISNVSLFLKFLLNKTKKLYIHLFRTITFEFEDAKAVLKILFFRLYSIMATELGSVTSFLCSFCDIFS